MLTKLWDQIFCLIISTFLPLVSFYHGVCQNSFLNVSVQEASGLEKFSNILLTPSQYIFAGKIAYKDETGEWKVKQRFEYESCFYIKTAASIIALPMSVTLGSFVKGLALMSDETKHHLKALRDLAQQTQIVSNNDLYKKFGIEIIDPSEMEIFSPLNHQRRPGDENHLSKAKECLKDIATVLNQANLVWWVDCGTLLGTYRYGGVIPWDSDIDVSLLLPDFENARRALNKLDPSKYEVQDWSGRDFPDTFMKVYVKESKDLIDIYFYNIDFEKKMLTYIFSLDHSMFFPEWWKDGERRFTKPVGFDHVFPLKKSTFDSVEVFTPNQPIAFLQRYYGENLAPAKIYDPITNRFEKDLNHPYWQNPNVH